MTPPPLRKAKVHWCKVASLNYEGVKGYCKLKQVVLKKLGGGGAGRTQDMSAPRTMLIHCFLLVGLPQSNINT